MTWRELWEGLAGGTLPIVRRREREVFATDGVEYALELVWMRRRVVIEYSTPRYPRDVRRIRDQENARVREFARRKLAGEELYQTGDILSGRYTWIPGEVLSFVDSEGDEWHRAFGDLRYAVEDGTGQLNRSQEYDWVHMFEGEPAGWSTDEGRLDYAPLRITRAVSRADDPA